MDNYMTYQELKIGDTFKIQPEGKMVQYDLFGHRCKDRSVFMKTCDGSIEIIDCHGNKWSGPNCRRIYCYLSMPVYSVNLYKVVL